MLELSSWADRKGIKIEKAVGNSNGVKLAPIMYKLPENISILEDGILEGGDSIL